MAMRDNGDHCTYGECTRREHVECVLDAQTQNGDEPVGEYSFLGQSCLSSADSC